MKYSECPKTEHPKMGKRQSPNKYCFGFWRFIFQMFGPLSLQQICPEPKAFNSQLSKNRAKIVLKLNIFVRFVDIVRITNHLEMGQKLNVPNPNVLGFWTLTVLQIRFNILVFFRSELRSNLKLDSHSANSNIKVSRNRSCVLLDYD